MAKQHYKVIRSESKNVEEKQFMPPCVISAVRLSSNVYATLLNAAKEDQVTVCRRPKAINIRNTLAKQFRR